MDLISELTSRPHHPVINLFTRGQSLQDGLQFLEQLFVIAILDSHRELRIGGQPHSGPIRIDQRAQQGGINRRLWMKAHGELVGAQHRAHDHQFAHLPAHVHRLEQILHQGRHRSEAVAQFIAQIVEVLHRLGARHPAVQHQALALVGA